MSQATRSTLTDNQRAIWQSYMGSWPTSLFDFSRPSQPTAPPLSPPTSDWQAWLAARFPSYVVAPFAERHAALWRWFADLRLGTRPAPLLAIWPRGGAKSTTTELGVAYAQQRRARRFVVYVSETQDQANTHVQNVAELLESLGAARAVNKYKASKGWTQYLLRTADGFNLRAFGLDAGARGVKLGQDRPDMIVFDDIDAKHDSQATTAKKKETIAQTLLLAGTSDCAVLFVQNLVHAASIATQLADGTAGFLSDRVVSGPYPALRNFTADGYVDADGQQRYTVGGDPTWAGQDLAACQRLVDTAGLTAFEVECQHEVGRGKHLIYDCFDERLAVDGGHLDIRHPIPDDWQRYMGMDFGGTNTAAIFFAEDPATKRLIAYRVYWAGGKTAKEHAADLLAGEPASIFCVGGSKSEGQWRREFRQAGLPIAEPLISDVWVGIQRVYGVLKRHEVVFFDDLPHVFAELRDYRRKVDALGEPTNEIDEKRRFHLLDATRYILSRIRS